MRINDWNKADVALYGFFNKTFWNKIAKQDETFFHEVEELRRKVKNVEEHCVQSYQTNHDTGEVEIKLFAYTANVNIYLCEKMIMKEDSYVAYLKKKLNIKLDGYNNYQRQLHYNMFNKTRLEDSLYL